MASTVLNTYKKNKGFIKKKKTESKTQQQKRIGSRRALYIFDAVNKNKIFLENCLTLKLGLFQSRLHGNSTQSSFSVSEMETRWKLGKTQWKRVS